MPDFDTSAYSTTTLSGILAEATRRMASFCNVKAFDFGTYTDTDKSVISNEGELLIMPWVRPLQSVVSVTLVKGGFSTNLTLTDSNGNPLYQIPEPQTSVHFPNTYLYLTGTYLAGGSSQLYTLKGANTMCKVVYTAGWSVMPDDLKDAACLFVQDIIARRYNRAGASSVTQGKLSMAFSQKQGGDSPLIQEAKDILWQGDYVRLVPA
jgi:hypothetical protein